MADENPRQGTRIVRVDLPSVPHAIVLDEIEGQLSSVEDDLQMSDIANREGNERRAATYRRLRDAVRSGSIRLPDEEARAAVAELVEADEESLELREARKLIALVDAERQLLALLDHGRSVADEENGHGPALAAPADGGSQQTVLIDLEPRHREIVFWDVRGWLQTMREDIAQSPDQFDEDQKKRHKRRVAALERVFEGLNEGELHLPDEEALEMLQEAAADHEKEHAKAIELYFAQRAFLALFLGPGEEARGDFGSGATEPAEEWISNRSEDTAMESVLLQHVLETHPAVLSEAELAREIAGARPSFGERDALERAIARLDSSGVLRTGGGVVAPAWVTLRLVELIDR
jgi:hypothetical protein